jgi:hypothetical protein
MQNIDSYILTVRSIFLEAQEIVAKYFLFAAMETPIHITRTELVG